MVYEICIGDEVIIIIIIIMSTQKLVFSRCIINHGLISSNKKGRLFQTARHLFDETRHCHISFFNMRLASHVRHRDPVAAWDLFIFIHRLRSDLDSYTFTPILAACSALPNPARGLQVHAFMVKLGIDSQSIPKTALLKMYSQYGMLDDSLLAFHEIEQDPRDVITWNALIAGFLHNESPLNALRVFGDMRAKKNVEFNEFTLCSVVKACTALCAYRQGKQVHALVVLMGRDLVVLSTALIDFYSRVGFIDDAIKIFRCLSLSKDVIITNVFINACIRNKRYDEALMVMGGVRPNVVAMTSALAACAEISDLWMGKQIHGVTIRQEFMSDTQLCNALLDMYAKCGRLLSGRLVFERMYTKDVVSWTTMIDAYGSHGRGVEAFELFNKMRGEEDSTGVLPNAITFLAVLSACAHSDLVEQGFECFALAKKYNVDLGTEHYVCFVDLLGRAGHTEAISCLFDEMAKNVIKPTPAMWAALLNACKRNHDVARGEIACMRLLESEPNNPSHNVAASNFYAVIGRWDAVGILRRIMKTGGINKELGRSWVTTETGSNNLTTHHFIPVQLRHRC